MIYFGYPLDIHGWKTKPETEPDWFRGPNLKTVGEKSSPNPNSQDPKPADIRPETAPLPSLDRQASGGVLVANWQCMKAVHDGTHL